MYIYVAAFNFGVESTIAVDRRAQVYTQQHDNDDNGCVSECEWDEKDEE